MQQIDLEELEQRLKVWPMPDRIGWEWVVAAVRSLIAEVRRLRAEVHDTPRRLS